MEECNDCLPVGFHYDNIIIYFLCEISNETLERNSKSTPQSFSVCRNAPRKFVYSEFYSLRLRI